MRFFVEYFPIIIFFFIYKYKGFFWATTSIILLTPLSTIGLYLLMKRIPWMGIITTIVVLITGIATLTLHDPCFVKIKPTVVQLFFSIFLWVGLIWKKRWLYYLFGEHIKMLSRDWDRLTHRVACFFFLSALLNEYIRRIYTTSIWVQFHTFGMIPLIIIFFVFQIPFFRRAEKDYQAALDIVL